MDETTEMSVLNALVLKQFFSSAFMPASDAERALIRKDDEIIREHALKEIIRERALKIVTDGAM